MKKNGYTVAELLVVIAIFGVVYFIAANKVSYAFDTNYDVELYNQTITSIEECAIIYGENNLNLFTDTKDYYITIGDLAREGIILNNGQGSVTDPRDTNKTLNDLKVKITYENNKVTAKVLV
ncbi:MAG: type II secretion system GspH family protein [Bacilli bacterium]|nr:type II secretion system GspH family protein [Bacilli bacterium]